MSALRGWLTPEARATLEAVLAKLAAPGMCNPLDDRLEQQGMPVNQEWLIHKLLPLLVQFVLVPVGIGLWRAAVGILKEFKPSARA